MSSSAFALVNDNGIATVVGGGLVIGGRDGVLNGPMTLLFTSISGAAWVLDIEGQNLSHVHAPNLVTIEQESVINLPRNQIISVEFPSLTRIDTQAIIAIANNRISSISLPNLDYMGDATQLSFSLSQASNELQSFSLPRLTGFGPNFPAISLGRNSALSTISFPILNSVASLSLQAAECALTAQTVNTILVQINSLRTSTDISIDFSGGTSATPTGAGLAAATAMTNAGCSITTN